MMVHWSIAGNMGAEVVIILHIMWSIAGNMGAEVVIILHIMWSIAGNMGAEVVIILHIMWHASLTWTNRKTSLHCIGRCRAVGDTETSLLFRNSNS